MRRGRKNGLNIGFNDLGKKCGEINAFEFFFLRMFLIGFSFSLLSLSLSFSFWQCHPPRTPSRQTEKVQQAKKRDRNVTCPRDIFFYLWWTILLRHDGQIYIYIFSLTSSLLGHFYKVCRLSSTVLFFDPTQFFSSLHGLSMTARVGISVARREARRRRRGGSLNDN